MRKKSFFKRAFTLIELLFVISILGALSSSAIKDIKSSQYNKNKNLIISQLQNSLYDVSSKTQMETTDYNKETIIRSSTSSPLYTEYSRPGVASEILKYVKIKQSPFYQKGFYNVLKLETGTKDYLTLMQFSREGCDKRVDNSIKLANGNLPASIDYNKIDDFDFTGTAFDKCLISEKKVFIQNNNYILKKVFLDGNLASGNTFYIFKNIANKTEFFIADENSIINSNYMNYFGLGLNTEIVSPNLFKEIFLEFGSNGNSNHCEVGDFEKISFIQNKSSEKRNSRKNLICFSLNKMTLNNFINLR